MSSLVELRSQIEQSKLKEQGLVGIPQRATRENTNFLKRVLGRVQMQEMLTAANRLIPEGPLKNKAREIFKKASIDIVGARDLL